MTAFEGYERIISESAAHNKKGQRFTEPREGAKLKRKAGRIPITKNTDFNEKKTVRIVDADGNEIGRTYPKRAAGLVKKGRACYMNDFQIRLNTSDTEQNSEVHKMDDKMMTNNESVTLYFDPRRWSFNRDCPKNVGSRSFMQGPDGELAEAYTIGDWKYNWTEIVSETLLLKKRTTHRFVFWLNGGENDRNDEVCRFEVIYNNDVENRRTYNLNRNFIKPVRTLNNWELYEIPFTTEDNEYTQLKFAAQAAYMTVMAAKESGAYEGIPDQEDPYKKWRPQRHNLIFEDGFPANGWYSTENLRRRHGHELRGSQGKAGNDRSTGSASETVRGLEESRRALEDLKEQLEALSAGSMAIMAETVEKLDPQHIAKEVRSMMPQLEEEDVDIEDVISDAVDEVRDALEEIRDAIEEVGDRFEEVRDTMEEVNETLCEEQESSEW